MDTGTNENTMPQQKVDMEIAVFYYGIGHLVDALFAMQLSSFEHILCILQVVGDH